MTLPSYELASTTLPRSPRRRVRRPRELHHLTPLIHLLLRTPLLHVAIDGRVCELRWADPATGRRASVSVIYAWSGNEIVALVTAGSATRWWRAFRGRYPVDVLLHRGWHHGHCRTVTFGQPEWDDAKRVYTDRYGAFPVEDPDIFVVVTFTEPLYP
jgi:hypothetical protein